MCDCGRTDKCKNFRQGSSQESNLTIRPLFRTLVAADYQCKAREMLHRARNAHAATLWWGGILISASAANMEFPLRNGEQFEFARSAGPLAVAFAS